MIEPLTADQVSRLTTEQVRDQLRQIVDLVALECDIDPQMFRYRLFPFGSNGQMCRYVVPSGTAPACIVGQWLHRVGGVPLDVLADNEYEGAPSIIRDVLPDTPRDVLEYLRDVQVEQDKNNRWQFAIEVCFERGQRVSQP